MYRHGYHHNGFMHSGGRMCLYYMSNHHKQILTCPKWKYIIVYVSSVAFFSLCESFSNKCRCHHTCQWQKLKAFFHLGVTALAIYNFYKTNCVRVFSFAFLTIFSILVIYVITQISNISDLNDISVIYWRAWISAYTAKTNFCNTFLKIQQFHQIPV